MSMMEKENKIIAAAYTAYYEVMQNFGTPIDKDSFAEKYRLNLAYFANAENATENEAK